MIMTFLRQRFALQLKEDVATSPTADEQQQNQGDEYDDEYGTRERQQTDDAESEPILPPEIASLLDECTTRTLLTSLLSTYYLPLETWYLRTIIHKSHRLAVLDASAIPPQHTTPDDVFYILKSVLSRCVGIGEIGALERMVGGVAREVLERDYVGVLRGKLEDVYAGQAQGGIARGGQRAVEKAERESRTTFMVRMRVSATTSPSTASCFA